jgi:hypothetical protein
VKCSLLQLSCYVDGELNPQQRGQMDAHLVGCNRCRGGLAYLGEEAHRVSSLARVHVPDHSVHELLEMVGLIGAADPLPERSNAVPGGTDSPAPPWLSGGSGGALPWDPRRAEAEAGAPPEEGGEAFDFVPFDGGGGGEFSMPEGEVTGSAYRWTDPDPGRDEGIPPIQLSRPTYLVEGTDPFEVPDPGPETTTVDPPHGYEASSHSAAPPVTELTPEPARAGAFAETGVRSLAGEARSLFRRVVERISTERALAGNHQDIEASLEVRTTPGGSLLPSPVSGVAEPAAAAQAQVWPAPSQQVHPSQPVLDLEPATHPSRSVAEELGHGPLSTSTWSPPPPANEAADLAPRPAVWGTHPNDAVEAPAELAGRSQRTPTDDDISASMDRLRSTMGPSHPAGDVRPAPGAPAVGALGARLRDAAAPLWDRRPAVAISSVQARHLRRERPLIAFAGVTAVVLMVGLATGRSETPVTGATAQSHPAPAGGGQTNGKAAAAPAVAAPGQQPGSAAPAAPQAASVISIGSGGTGVKVAGVRYGAHPGDFRIVFDMNGGAAPNVAVATVGTDVLRVTVSGATGGSPAQPSTTAVVTSVKVTHSGADLVYEFQLAHAVQVAAAFESSPLRLVLDLH